MGLWNGGSWDSLEELWQGSGGCVCGRITVQMVVAFKRNGAYTFEVLAQTYMRAINLKPRRCGDFSTNDPSKGHSRAEAMDTQSGAGHQLS